MRFQQGTGYTFKNTESGEEICATFILGNAKALVFAPTSGGVITAQKPPKGRDDFSISHNGKYYTFQKPEKAKDNGNGLSADSRAGFDLLLAELVAKATVIAGVCIKEDTSYHQDLGNGYILRIRKIAEKKPKVAKAPKAKKRK